MHCLRPSEFRSETALNSNVVGSDNQFSIIDRFSPRALREISFLFAFPFLSCFSFLFLSRFSSLFRSFSSFFRSFSFFRSLFDFSFFDGGEDGGNSTVSGISSLSKLLENIGQKRMAFYLNLPWSQWSLARIYRSNS